MAATEEDELIINLKVLASLQPNSKLVTRDTYLNVEIVTWVPQSVKRWHRGDSREETLKKIDSLIRKSLELYTTKPILEEYLRGAVSGLSNLKETYSSCIQTCSRLDTIIDKMNRALLEDKNKKK